MYYEVTMKKRKGKILKDISNVDYNFIVEADIKKDGLAFYDAAKPPFSLHGITYEDEKFRRLPEAEARDISEGVYVFHTHTAGGRVRFKTNSSSIAIMAQMPTVNKMPHGTVVSTAGFDMYIGNDQAQYIKTFVPPFEVIDGFESAFQLESSEWRDFTINFPLFSEVGKLYVGIQEGASLAAPTPYKSKKPIVYYGSSTTQGGCASRPGNTYENIISRRLCLDHVNLGFSGSAKGETKMADYIRRMDMLAFVYDYDFNAPTVAHLRQTHEPMFRMIRESQPDLPIIILSKPRFCLTKDDMDRLDVIKATYDHAKANGDEHVYLIDGPDLMHLAKNDGTVDGTHPNDLGFASIAKAVGDVLDAVLLDV